MRPRHRHAHIARRSDRLTPAMRAALKAAKSQPLRRTFDDRPGKPPWPAPPGTLYALFRRGHVVGVCRRSRRGLWLEEWAATDTGLEALKPATVVRRDTVRLLRVPGGSTRMMQLGTWVDVRIPEPEVMRDAA